MHLCLPRLDALELEGMAGGGRNPCGIVFRWQLLALAKSLHAVLPVRGGRRSLASRPAVWLAWLSANVVARRLETKVRVFTHS